MSEFVLIINYIYVLKKYRRYNVYIYTMIHFTKKSSSNTLRKYYINSLIDEGFTVKYGNKLFLLIVALYYLVYFRCIPLVYYGNLY